jgi:hypothetical protein
MPPRRLLLWLCPILLLLVLSSELFAQGDPSPTPTPETDVSARSKALELAGAFSNDGYKIRDGYWPGEIEPNRPQFLEVNLFSGNEYWFSAAINPPGRKIAVAVFNEIGKPTDFQTYEDGQVAAAGFVPEVSGRYYVKLTLLEGEKAQFCLLYSYK